MSIVIIIFRSISPPPGKYVICLVTYVKSILISQTDYHHWHNDVCTYHPYVPSNAAHTVLYSQLTRVVCCQKRYSMMIMR
jgi:hypothetical protein